MVKGVWKLRIFQDAQYPGVIERGAAAMSFVCGNRVGFVQRGGCVEIHSHWKHWICLFPQHGPGEKHKRRIILAPWQQRLVYRYPEKLVVGLIHSDGSRVTNRVITRGTPYEYPRYFFTNHSDDIHGIFKTTCDAIGVECRPNNRWNVSIAKREGVAILDAIGASKR